MQETEVKETEELENEETQEPEDWMKTEEDGDSSVPVNTHIRMKQKLRGRLDEKDSKISELEKKLQELEQRAGQPQPQTQAPVERPKRSDFDDDDDYYAAVDRYFDKSIESRYHRLDQQRQQDQQVRTYQQTVQQSIDSHYERAAKLLEETGIEADLYKNADMAVRSAVDSVMRGNGDPITDQLIANMGDGSEKVMYFLGRNPSALAEFKALLAEDTSGIKASIYLGKKQAELTKPNRRRSNAPPPPSELPGGDATGRMDTPMNASAAKRKYDAAHKKGATGEAIKIKFKAKRAGIDTSGW